MVRGESSQRYDTIIGEPNRGCPVIPPGASTRSGDLYRWESAFGDDGVVEDTFKLLIVINGATMTRESDNQIKGAGEGCIGRT